MKSAFVPNLLLSSLAGPHAAGAAVISETSGASCGPGEVVELSWTAFVPNISFSSLAGPHAAGAAAISGISVASCGTGEVVELPWTGGKVELPWTGGEVELFGRKAGETCSHA